MRGPATTECTLSSEDFSYTLAPADLPTGSVDTGVPTGSFELTCRSGGIVAVADLQKFEI